MLGRLTAHLNFDPEPASEFCQSTSTVGSPHTSVDQGLLLNQNLFFAVQCANACVRQLPDIDLFRNICYLPVSFEPGNWLAIKLYKRLQSNKLYSQFF